MAAGKKVLNESFTATGVDGSSFTEKILIDSRFEDMGDLRTKDLLNDYLNFDPDRPVIGGRTVPLPSRTKVFPRGP